MSAELIHEDELALHVMLAIISGRATCVHFETTCAVRNNTARIHIQGDVPFAYQGPSPSHDLLHRKAELAAAITVQVVDGDCDFATAERMMLFWGGVVDRLTKAGKGPAR